MYEVILPRWRTNCPLKNDTTETESWWASGVGSNRKIEMEDINYYIQESKKALSEINENRDNKLSSLDFQINLAKKLGYDRNESTKVASHRLTSEQMLKFFENVDIEIPNELGQVIFFESILPKGVPSRIDEKQLKVKGEIWRIHKYDKDSCPSNPHAHNVETGYKLHLGNGQLFDYKCNPLGKQIKRKHLIEIRKQLREFTLPKLTI